jgi:hypothetical protein
MNITALIIIIVFAVVVLVAINLGAKTVPKGIDKQYFIQEWQDITAMYKDEKTRAMSIVQADKLLDEALKCLAYKGSTMGERLISAKMKLKHRDEIWKAHKLRNKIVHEPKFKLKDEQAKEALKGYFHTFKDLGVW